MWRPETWKSLLLISELRLEEAHAIIEAGTREAENISRNIRVWSMLRCRARLAAGQLADARAEAEAILDMSDEMGDGSFGYLNHIASYVLGDIALRTGDPVALQTARRDAAGLYGTGSGCATTERLGAWLTVRLDRGHIGPDLLDVLAPGYVHACSPIGHCDAVELVRLLLAAGQRPDAASVTARLENGADANPSFPGLRAAALHARALLDNDPERALAALDQTRKNAAAVANKGIDDITSGYLDVVSRLPAKPIVIGHSFGGLVAQKLLSGGMAAAAIAIDPGQIKGVKPLPFAQIRSGLPVLSRPGNKKRAVALTRRQFRYGFGNALTERESGELFDKWAIPGPGKPLFEASAANFKKSSPAAVDTRKQDRGPLLIVGGGEDHTVREVVARAAYKRYSGSGAVTSYHAFPDRGHSLVLDHGWREVADFTLSWLASQDL